MLEEFARIAGFALDVEQRFQPLMRAFLHVVQIRAAVLVEPVRGHAGFRDLVHLARAHLEFDRRAERPDERRVQRLIAVDLRDCDVVLELAGYGLVERMQRADARVAVERAVDDDAKAVHVEHLRERQLLVAHLAVDAVDRLFAPGDLGVELRVGHRALRGLENLADHFAAIAARGLHGLLERRVAMRIEVREAHVLQLAIRIVQTEPVRDRRIDVERFARDAATLFHRHRAERAHIVQAVGELHEDHAHVARHREQHLAEVFRLRFLATAEFHLVEFRQAVDELGDLRAEALGELALRDALVFHHVVQQRRHDRLRVELPARTDFGDGDRMGDVGFAALAILTEVGFVAEMERRLHLFDFVRTEILGKRGRQIRNRNDAVLARLLRSGGRPEQMPEGLFEDRVDVLARWRPDRVFGDRIRGGGRWGGAHIRLLVESLRA